MTRSPASTIPGRSPGARPASKDGPAPNASKRPTRQACALPGMPGRGAAAAAAREALWVCSCEGAASAAARRARARHMAPRGRPRPQSADVQPRLPHPGCRRPTGPPHQCRMGRLHACWAEMRPRRPARPRRNVGVTPHRAPCSCCPGACYLAPYRNRR